jgi:hypothetical protein
MGLAVTAVVLSPSALADPWLAPGDSSLRHDIELLADAAVIRSPVTTWPMSWPDIARDVLQTEQSAVDAEDTLIGVALLRVQHAARRAMVAGFADSRIEASGAEKPATLRTFEDIPREDAEVSFEGAFTGDRWAMRLKAEAVVPARVDGHEDDKKIRLDGSYLGLSIANLMVSAGAMDRWWGPGWEGSLIYSSNARPIPSIAVERLYSDSPKWRGLRWIGPWKAFVSLGKLDQDDVAVEDANFFAARVNFRPRSWLEIGLSRTAQWCGKGRACDLSTFGNLLIGRDNRSASLPESKEPGNQMAGYDFRLRSPSKRIPAALYGQLIGEDEAGGLPSRLLGLMGAEVWTANSLGSYRLHAEYANTSCNFSRQKPLLGCAYRNLLYPQGYTFEGRTIGHALDRDGRMYSFGALWVREGGDSFSFLIRKSELNRGALALDPPHPASPIESTITNLELQYNRPFTWGKLSAGLGADDYTLPARTRSEVRGFIQWAQPLAIGNR